MGMIIATKILCHWVYEIPRTELPMILRACIVLRALLAKMVTWVVHWRVGVKKTPRYLIWLATRRVICGRMGSLRVCDSSVLSPTLNPSWGDSESLTEGVGTEVPGAEDEGRELTRGVFGWGGGEG